MNKDTIFTLDEYSKGYEWIENNTDYTIKEIEKSSNGERQFCFELKYEVTHKEEIAIEIELAELDNWFKWYDNQVAQYNRCQRLGIEFDKDINELDNQAKINQERIAQLRAKEYNTQNSEISENNI